MSGPIWDIGTEAEVRVFVRQQDARFRRIVRCMHPELAPKHVRKKRNRDVIMIAPSEMKRAPSFNADPNWMQIVAEVATKHELSIPEMLAHRREAGLVAARQEAMWRLKKETRMSLPAIGRKLGGFDHTTVLSGIRRHEARVAGVVQG